MREHIEALERAHGSILQLTLKLVQLETSQAEMSSLKVEGGPSPGSNTSGVNGEAS